MNASSKHRQTTDDLMHTNFLNEETQREVQFPQT